MTVKNLYSLFIFLGVLPFVFAVLAPFVGANSIPLIGDINRATALYTLIIVSYMSGIHWGIAISHVVDGSTKPQDTALLDTQANHSFVSIKNRQARFMMLASSLYTLVPWSCYLLTGISVWLYISLLVAFILILTTDAKLQSLGIISEHYYRSRRVVTVMVVVCLLLMAVKV